MPEPDTPRRLRGPWWFAGDRHLSEEQRHSVLAQLFFEGEDRNHYLGRFSALLVSAVLVAVFGLASDSAAVVIGAMLISPLTTPILGIAAALVLGWPRRQLEALALLLAASVAGVALAWLALKVLPEPSVVTLTSEQLLARTEPALLDLAVAIVAGGAGAYVLVRREAVGALPGVAIAVALVPPLATIGMMLELGEPAKAADAALLYATNLAGIVLAAGLVLLATGVSPRGADGRVPRRARAGLAVAGLVVLAIGVPLATVSAQRVADEVDTDDATKLIDSWASEQGLRVTEISVDDGTVNALLAGPRRPTGLDELAGEIEAELGDEVELRLGWTRETVLEARG